MTAILAAVMLGSCMKNQTKEVTVVSPAVTSTLFVPQASPTIIPTSTLTPTATITPVPPTLPPVFVSNLLISLDTPHTYINDICQELKLKWDPNNSAPGTVVMPIMIHGVAAGDEPPVRPSIDTNHNRLETLFRDLNQQGFVTITTQQLYDFLDHNAKIPLRSVILIVDDRHYADYFNTHFIPFLEKYNWKTVTNAFIAQTDTIQTLWDENAALAKSGWVDYQAHGVLHNTPISQYSTDEYINSELLGSISGLRAHFNVTPIAYIWPGGGFTPHAADLAVQDGYKLGFTINPRGPLMFNWIPLADSSDPMRPSYMPEGSVNKILMVLPRYWVTDADNHIDEVRVIGQKAAEYAAANKDIELQYYTIVCQPALGPIPALNP